MKSLQIYLYIVFTCLNRNVCCSDLTYSDCRFNVYVLLWNWLTKSSDADEDLWAMLGSAMDFSVNCICFKFTVIVQYWTCLFYWFWYSYDILHPAIPFALRLSSHLMFGISRIYQKQTKITLGMIIHDNLSSFMLLKAN